MQCHSDDDDDDDDDDGGTHTRWIFLIICAALSHGVEDEHKSEEMSEVREMHYIWATTKQTLTWSCRASNECCWWCGKHQWW